MVNDNDESRSQLFVLDRRTRPRKAIGLVNFLGPGVRIPDIYRQYSHPRDLATPLDGFFTAKLISLYGSLNISSSPSGALAAYKNKVASHCNSSLPTEILGPNVIGTPLPLSFRVSEPGLQ